MKQTKKLLSFKEKFDTPPFFETRLFSRIREKATVPSMLTEFANIARKTIYVSSGILLILIVSEIFLNRPLSIDKSQSYQLMENYLFRDNLTLTERKVFLEDEISEKDLIDLVIYNGR